MKVLTKLIRVIELKVFYLNNKDKYNILNSRIKNISRNYIYNSRSK